MSPPPLSVSSFGVDLEPGARLRSPTAPGSSPHEALPGGAVILADPVSHHPNQPPPPTSFGPSQRRVPSLLRDVICRAADIDGGNPRLLSRSLAHRSSPSGGRKCAGHTPR